MKHDFQVLRKSRLVIGIAAAISISSGFADSDDLGKLDLELSELTIKDAARALAVKSGLQIVLDKNVVPTVQLKRISGSYSLDEALELILSGTGLTYEYNSIDLIMIRSADDEEGDVSKNESDDSVDEEIVVTGSRLISDPGKLTRQITIIDRAEIERSGATRLDEFLQRLPQNINAPTNTGSGFLRFPQDFGLGANAFAGSSVNLRGLGSQYTLILIDGRRPARGGQFGAITDISNIPLARVSRIEILFDGAASIYGADAVGGVINIITNREYKGTDISLTYADTTSGGGERYNFDIGHTFRWESGSVTASMSVQKQGEIDSSQRRNIAFGTPSSFQVPISSPGNVGSSFFDFSTRTNNPLFYSRDVNGDGDTLDAELNERLSGGVEINTLDFFGNPNTTIVSRSNPVFFGSLAPGETLPDNPLDNGYQANFQAQLPEYNGQAVTLYDIADDDLVGEELNVPFAGLSLSPKDETYSVSLRLDQELHEKLQLNLSANYSVTDKVSSVQENSQTASISGNSLSNPFGVRIQYGYLSPFPQVFQDVHQTSISLTGSIDWSVNDNWSLRFGFGYSDGKNSSDTLNSLRTFSARDPITGDSIPSLVDLFNGFTQLGFGSPRVPLGTNFNDPLLGFSDTDTLLNSLVVPLLNTQNNSSSVDADISVQGSIFELPAGDVRVNVIASHIKQTTESSNNNDVTGRFETNLFVNGGNSNTNDPTEFIFSEKFDTKTSSIGAELSVPLVGSNNGLPFMDNFLVSLSSRYEDYSNTEDRGENWAAGFNWTVNDWMTLRFNRTYSLRVPDAVRSAREAGYSSYNPFGTAVTNPDGSFLDFIALTRWSFSGGSDHLRAERNYGTALGFILDPTFIDGMNIQVNITESNTVDQIGSPNLSGFTLQSLALDNVLRNPTLAYADPDNNPAHVLTAEEQARFGAVIMEGDLIVDNRVFNVGDTFTRGADLQVSYNYNSNWGDWLVTWRHQYLDVNEIIQSGICDDDVCQSRLDSFNNEFIGRPLDTVGVVNQDQILFASPLPRNQGNIELQWSLGGLGVNLSTRYQQATTLIRTPVAEFPRLRFSDPGQNVNIIAEKTTPARSINMVLSYDFADNLLFESPEWLLTTRLSLAVNDLWRIDRKVESRFVRQEFGDGEAPLQLLNPFTLEPRGRSFLLNIRTTF